LDTNAAAPDPAPGGSVGAQLAPQGPFERALALVPRALSSHAHIVFLGGLGVYLVLLPLFGVDVSARAELIGGNYTNVTSDLGACIAAGMTVHLVKRDRRRGQEIRDLLQALHSGQEAIHHSVRTALTAAQRAEAAAGTAEPPPPAGG
jgi:hypothetical protein